MFDEFQQEQNAILEKLVFDGIYPRLVKQARHAIIDGVNDQSFLLELYITPTCNKHCEYCYLQKHRKEIYPPEINNFDTIKKNLKILLNSFIERGYNHLNRIDIFSGEIWNIDYGYEILDIILNYLRAGFILDNFIIPTNGSFLFNDKYYNKMKDYVDAFNHYRCNFVLSFSYDGYIVEQEVRPFNDSKKNELSQDLLIDRLKEFHQDYNFGFHPMIYAENIDKQIDNFKWWVEFFGDEDIFEQTMLLEVRNNNWTDERIIGYLKWLKYVMEYHYHFLESHEQNFSKALYLEMIFGIGRISKVKTYNYLPHRLAVNRTASCGLTQGFCVRLGDLGICPCHRSSYSKLMIGNFIVENNKITGIFANNPQMAINIWMNGDSSWLKCDACALKRFCIKGCRGAQFEELREPMYPLETACEHAYAKQIYVLVNLLPLLKDIDIPDLVAWKHEILTVLNAAKQQDIGRYNKWTTIAQNMMLEI